MQSYSYFNRSQSQSSQSSPFNCAMASSADDWRGVLARAMTGRESGNILVFVAGHDDRTAPLAEAVQAIASLPKDWQLVLAFDQETLFGNEWVPELGPNVRVLSWKDDGAHYYSCHLITH